MGGFGARGTSHINSDKVSNCVQNEQSKTFNAMPVPHYMSLKKKKKKRIFILYKNIIAPSCLLHIISAERGVRSQCDCNIHLAFRMMFSVHHVMWYIPESLQPSSCSKQ